MILRNWISGMRPVFAGSKVLQIWQFWWWQWQWWWQRSKWWRRPWWWSRWWRWSLTQRRPTKSSHQDQLDVDKRPAGGIRWKTMRLACGGHDGHGEGNGDGDGHGSGGWGIHRKTMRPWCWQFWWWSKDDHLIFFPPRVHRDLPYHCPRLFLIGLWCQRGQFTICGGVGGQCIICAGGQYIMWWCQLVQYTSHNRD